MIKLSVLATIVATVFIVTPPANAQVTGSVLMENCLGIKENSTCQIYINGVIDGMRWGADAAAFQSGVVEPQAMRAQANTFLGACVPNGVNGNQLYAVALQHMKNNPKNWHNPAPALIHRALMEAFPCS